jgi:hypothetical protein
MKKTICANSFASYALVKVKVGSKKGKKGKKGNKGMGNGEWGMGVESESEFLIPATHSPFPTPYFLLRNFLMLF